MGELTKKFEVPEAIVNDSLISFYCKANDCNVEQAIKDFLIVDGPKTLAASKISGHPAPQTEVINIECLPILHKAASDGNIQHVKSLIEHAEDINAMSGFRNSTKYTPLMLAAKNGHLEVVQYLHQHGANITIKDSHQFNALYYAADNGHIDVVKYLIANGAKSDINTVTNRNYDGRMTRGWASGTPLFIAARKGYFSIVGMLITEVIVKITVVALKELLYFTL